VTKGRLQHVTQNYLSRLQAREAKAEQALEAGYKHTLASIQPKLDALYDQMVEAMAGGEQIPLHWLYEANRLQSLTRFIENQMNHFGALTDMQVRQLQHYAVDLGSDAAMNQLQATLPPGSIYAFNEPNVKAIANIIGATQSGSPLADLFAGFGSEAAQKASDALILGITTGQHPRTVANDIQQALGVSRARALTIAQNEMMRAFRSSSLETYQANSNIVSGWQWLASLGSACIACTEENGSIHPLDEDMASHVRCRCTMVPVTKSYSNILGIDVGDNGSSGMLIPDGSEWFARQDESTQRQILGSDARYEAYQNGVSLKDMVGIKHDPDWGSSIYIKPLKDLVKAR